MNRYRESLRLILTTNLSNTYIAANIGCAPNTIKSYRAKAKERRLEWENIKKLDDAHIKALLMKSPDERSRKREPDWHYVHSQKQMPGVTLRLLFEEYCEIKPEDAYEYSSFTQKYREYVNRLDLSMRQTHKAGEAVFVDFAGRRIPFYPPNEPKQYAEIFVGVLGCSKYTFAYACASQKLADWIDAHNRMYHFFGGVPQVTVPDNLKSAVTTPGPEPVLNRSYREMAAHYGTVVVPARVRRPKDKSPAEIGVQIFTIWIAAALRHRKFFSLQEINDEIAARLIHLNERPFKKLPGCRRSRFEEMDKPMLMLLPASLYEPTAAWVSAQRVRSDYHIYVEQHYYSVPYQLVGCQVEARTTDKTVEIFNLGKRVATHAKSHVAGGHTTLPEHQPVAHRKYAEQTPDHFRKWASAVGENTLAFVEHQFNRRPYSLPGVRVCSSLMRLSKDYGTERVEAACERANRIGSLTLKSVKSILKRNLDAQSILDLPVQGQLPLHYNVRGPEYYGQRS